MKLEVIIPTYNRAEMLRRTLTSMIAADKSSEMAVRVVVVDNNSKDHTRKVVEEIQAGNKLDLHYIFEPRQGRTKALNTGIKNADADLLGTIDDDEEVARNWFTEVEKIFTERWDSVDFISGCCLPNFETSQPAWLPPTGYNAVIGKIDCGEDELIFGQDFNGILSGGNSVIKLSVFCEIGLYNEDLGRTEKGLLTCDDDEMHHRLLNAGKRGIHDPKLLIYHFVPQSRLTKKYHRVWCYGWGKSRAVMERIIPPLPLPRFFGVPRYMYGDAVRGLLKMFGSYLRFNSNAAFQHELPFWVLAGYINSKFKKNKNRKPKTENQKTKDIIGNKPQSPRATETK